LEEWDYEGDGEESWTGSGDEGEIGGEAEGEWRGDGYVYELGVDGYGVAYGKMLRRSNKYSLRVEYARLSSSTV
jgi:hypothetical protein